jgi:hypothetical protein
VYGPGTPFGGGLGGLVVPGTEMAQDLLDDAPVVDDGDDAFLAGAGGLVNCWVDSSLR